MITKGDHRTIVRDVTRDHTPATDCSRGIWPRTGSSSRAPTRTRNKLFTLDLDSRMTVLDALFIIQREHDPSLSFRCSCRVGMCGTCAMRINWMPRLACQTRVETLNAESITIEPLASLPVSKDLVVDLGPFFAKWKKVRPALHPKNKDSKELAIVRPDSEFGRQAQVKRDCITCGACYSVCGIAGSNETTSARPPSTGDAPPARPPRRQRRRPPRQSSTTTTASGAATPNSTASPPAPKASTSPTRS